MESQLPHQYGTPGCNSCLLTVGLTVGIFSLVLYWFLANARLHKAKHPPGPSSSSLWENWSLNNHVSLQRKCKECVKIYGSVFSIKLGSTDVVILNDMASIKQFYCSEDEPGRSEKSLFYEVSRGTFGMFNLGGEAGTEHRSFSLRVLRDLGFGKTSMEELIKEELLNLVNEIDGAKERGIPVFELLLQSLLNTISALLLGTRYPLGGPKCKYLAKLAGDFIERIHCAPIIQFKPQWLCRVEARLPFTRTGAMRRCRLAMIDFIGDQIKEHANTIQADVTRDFIDAFLKKVEKHRHDPNSAFQVCHLVGNTVELFFSSSSNLPVMIHWLLLVCAQSPDTVQARIQKEVDDVVGSDRMPTWEDRKLMPFTMASILEITRWKVTEPIGMPRGVQEDTSIGEYLIPKGTAVVANVMAVHRNTELWENPDRFDPERFLTADGSELSKKPEHYIAFSLGKRICPAENLANIEMFLYLATILQKFSVFPDDGAQLPDLGCLSTSWRHPSVTKLRFVRRR